MDLHQASSFSSELRRRRTAANLSLAQLSALVHYSKSHLSKIENGVKAPSVDLARRCDAALDANGELAALVPLQATADTDVTEAMSGEEWMMMLDINGQGQFQALHRREVLGMGTAALLNWRLTPRSMVPERRDAVAIEPFRAMLAEARRLGQVVEPAAVIPILVSQTHALRLIARDAEPALRGQLLIMAGRFAEYTGWMVQESGDDRGAMWWTDQAVDLATAGGDEELVVYAYVRRALIALYRHDAVNTIGLAQRARSDQCGARVRGLAAQREAQGHAIAGDYDNCRRCLDHASDLLARPDGGDGQPTLGTSTLVDPVGLVTGWCLLDLGRARQAAEVLERGLHQIPPTAHRAQVRYGARYALALAASGELRQACHEINRLLSHLARVDSATIRTDLRRLAQELRRWPTDPAVREIMPQLADALRDTPTPA